MPRACASGGCQTMTTRTSTTHDAEAAPLRADRAPAWSVQDATRLYGIDAWGKGFFAVNKAGHVVVRPRREGLAVPPREVDLYEIVSQLRREGLGTPMILGFTDILARRIEDLRDAFDAAIAERGYGGSYGCIYPIKVNQQRHVVEEILSHEGAHGLEVGSKAELLAALGMTAGCPDRLIICNGFKDASTVRFALMASKLGQTVVPVIEHERELGWVMEQAERLGVRPALGVRVSLHARGSSRWEHPSADRGKFGLTIPQLLRVVGLLKQRRMLNCLALVHSHMASQLNDLACIEEGVTELARVYAELVKMGAAVRWIDVGGGLGVDYDGSQSSRDFSINYTMADYASSVVQSVLTVCDAAGVSHPTIVTEAGRALAAHHGVLVFGVHGERRHEADAGEADDSGASADPRAAPPSVQVLSALHARAHDAPLMQLYQEATSARERALRLFSNGKLDLEGRGLVDRLYWSICAVLRQRSQDARVPSADAERLAVKLSDTYLCNLSVFQSLPDSWAIGQVFPVMPIHRLDERPSRSAVLGDLTCDSDGVINHFARATGTKRLLEVHALREGENYYLAAFLIGAYQETLGDMHNLFGDTHVVHVRVDEQGHWSIDETVRGDTVGDLLGYVEYDTDGLRQNVRRACAEAVRAGRLTERESRTLAEAYESGLKAYPYLDHGK